MTQIYDTLVRLIFTPLAISESGHILCSKCRKPSEARNEKSSLAVFSAYNASALQIWYGKLMISSPWSALLLYRSDDWPLSVSFTVFMKKCLINGCLLPSCPPIVSLWSSSCSVTSDGFGSLVPVEATTTYLEVLASSGMFCTTAFCLCIFCFACCIRAKQPLFATWISLSHNLHTALNLSLSCDLHHHSSKCPFESFFFSQLLLNLVFEWDILKYLVTPQFNLKIITLLIQRKKSML